MQHNRLQHSHTQQGGFSLIEVLVALSLFTIVVTMSVGTMLILIDANGKAQNMQSIMTNLGYALDSMTRDIRTGVHYQCGSITLTTGSTATGDCISGGASTFAFTESGSSITGTPGGRIGYRLNNGAIERNITGDNSVSNWMPITASDINITTLEFTVTGSSDADDYNPFVTIVIAGQAANGSVNVTDDFSLQATIAQRSPDL